MSQVAKAVWQNTARQEAGAATRSKPLFVQPPSLSFYAKEVQLPITRL